MGLFSRKKKSAPSSIRSAPSPSSSFSTICPSPPASPGVAYYPSQPFFDPIIALRVAVDPASHDGDASVFTIVVDHEAGIERIRGAIAEMIGTTSTSLFKVTIPQRAHDQAVDYRRRFSTPVNLLTAFPAFNLDDPRQLAASLGLPWSTPVASSLLVKDWFPDLTQGDCISILVRTSESSSSRAPPVTFVSHFAPCPTEQLPPFGSPKSVRSPAVVCISPTQTVRELKAAILRADQRVVEEELLDRVVLWRVEMSEEEMVVIGERGGLKNGRMPWPYPPGSLVPISLSDSNLPISHYFPQTKSNARMVSLSVYLDQEASTAMPRAVAATQPPQFRYPMSYAAEEEVKISSRRSRQRPVTAPAYVDSRNNFDSRNAVPLSSLAPHTARIPDTYGPARPRIASPLSSSSVATRRGLGINMPEFAESRTESRYCKSPSVPTLAPITRGSISSSCASSDDQSLPSLSFSQLSLTLDPMDRNGPLTPHGYDVVDWLETRRGSGGKKAFAEVKNNMVYN